MRRFLALALAIFAFNSPAFASSPRALYIPVGSTLAPGQTADPVPGQPTLTVTPGNTQNSLAFTDTGATSTSHQIYRGLTSGSETLLTSITSASPYVDTGLTNGQTYFYQVAASNATGQGPLSAEVSGTPNVITRPVQEIALGGMVPNISATVSGTLTRIKGFRTYTLGNNPSSEITPTFSNWYISSDTTSENSIPTGNTIQKVALVINGVSVPVTFSGSRSHAMAAGETLIQADTLFPSAFGLSQFSAGQTVQVREMEDIAAAGGIYATTQGREGIAAENGYIYDPAVTPTDDIDSTSTMTVPSGATTKGFMIHKPTMLLGRFTVPTVVLLNEGDSKFDGVGDYPATNSGLAFGPPPTLNSGGGWDRRAATGLGLAYTNISLTGRAIGHYAANHAKELTLFQYHTHGIQELAINDNTANTTTVRTNLRGIWADMKAQGIQKVYQIIPGTETTSSDQWVTLVNQTVAAAFQSGGNMDVIRNNIAADFSAGTFGLDGTIDERPTLCDSTDPTRYRLTGFSTTLAAATTGSLSQFLTLAASPVIGDALVVDPLSSGNPSGSNEVSLVAIITPSGGNFITTGSSVTNPSTAKAIGTAVIAGYTRDGTHPSPRMHGMLDTGLLRPLEATFTGY